MKHLIRKVRPSDQDELVSLWRKSFLDAYSDLHSPENIQAYFSQHYNATAAAKILADHQFECHFAYRDQHKVGLIILHHHPCPIRPELPASELKHLDLLASEYGSGLAQQMMRNSFTATQKLGNNWMWLCVSDLNHRAQRFYQKMGFEAIGKGPTLEVGKEKLPSSIMIRAVD